MKRLFTQNLSLFVLAALLLPLFYINVKDSHDWGDDFAQYFIQARNILEHRPQTDNGLVFDSQTGEYALQAYPAGFPLILAAGWWFFGDSIIVSSLTLSLCYFAFGIACFFYFRKYFSQIISVLLVLLLIYNPQTIGFKREILSDVPFSFFLLAAVLMFQSGRKAAWFYILTGVVWGFAMSVRGIGAALFLAAGCIFIKGLIQLLSQKNKDGAEATSLKKIIIVGFSALGFYLLLNAVLIPVPSGGILRFYADAIRGENFGKWILMNLNYYYGVFLNFFDTMGGSYQWLSTATKFILLALIPVGLLVSVFRKMNFDDWLFLAYLLVLLVYPYLGGGFRFLVPVMPFLLRYIFRGFFFLLEAVRIKQGTPAIVFLGLIIIQYIPGISDQLKSMDYPEEGPQGANAQEAFEVIRNLPPGSVVVFLKPRALSYYSGKQAAYVTRGIAPEDLPGLFSRMNAHYFLLCSENEEVNDVVLQNFIEANAGRLNKIWNNGFFRLYTDLK